MLPVRWSNTKLTMKLTSRFQYKHKAWISGSRPLRTMKVSPTSSASVTNSKGNPRRTRRYGTPGDASCHVATVKLQVGTKMFQHVFIFQPPRRYLNVVPLPSHCGSPLCYTITSWSLASHRLKVHPQQDLQNQKAGKDALNDRPTSRAELDMK